MAQLVMFMVLVIEMSGIVDKYKNLFMVVLYHFTSNIMSDSSYSI